MFELSELTSTQRSQLQRSKDNRRAHDHRYFVSAVSQFETVSKQFERMGSWASFSSETRESPSTARVPDPQIARTQELDALSSSEKPKFDGLPESPDSWER